MLANGAELCLQASAKLGVSGKKFTKTNDFDFVFIGDDSARFGHEPSFIPPFPSVISSHSYKILFSPIGLSKWEYYQ